MESNDSGYANNESQEKENKKNVKETMKSLIQTRLLSEFNPETIGMLS